MIPHDAIPSDPRLLQDEAQAWLLRLTSGDATTVDAAALKRWCDRSPAHAAAFAEANLLWDMCDDAARNLADRNRAPGAPLSGRVAGNRIARRAFLGGAIAASAAGLAYPPLSLWPSLTELVADYRTGAGEQRRIALAEGTAVSLNTRSSLSIRSAQGRDAIELIAGEAAIVTGTSDPLVVIAADGKVIARRARFNIRHDRSDVCVTCLEGEVRVEQGERVATLRQQQQVLYGARGLEHVALVDPAVVAAWQEGMLVFRSEPLARVIDEVNRYRAGKIILLNAQLGRRAVEASFRLDRIDDVIALVRDLYDARVTRFPGGVVVLS